ncbi:MAG: hypothetical protein AB7E85_01435 [Pseudobdellovibrionaceae bacterium]
MRLFSVDFMGAALAGSALLLNNPAGHTLMQEMGLRIAFHEALLDARVRLNMPNMDFETFRELAPIALAGTYADMEDYKEAVAALSRGSTPFCLPTSDENNGKSPIPGGDQPQACHAVCARHDDEDSDDEGNTKNRKPDGSPSL